MKYLKWLNKVASPVAGRIFGVVLCQLLLSAIALTYVFISKSLIDVACCSPDQAGETLSRIPFCHGSDRRDALIFLAAAMMGVIILRISLQSLVNWWESKSEVLVANRLRHREFSNLLHMQSDYRNKWHSGDIVNRLQGDVNVVAAVIGRNTPTLIGAFFRFTAAFVYLVVLEARLAWILAIILPAGIFGGRFIMMRIRHLSLAVRKSDSNVQSALQENIQHLALIRSLEHEEASGEEVALMQEDYYSKVMHRTRFGIIARVLTALAFSLGYAVAFLWGVRGIYHGVISFGLMTAFLQLVGQIQRPLVELSDQLPGLFQCSASIDRLMEIENAPSEDPGESRMMNGSAGIRFEDVSFRYPDGVDNIFTGFSHDFKPGSHTAVVGETGIGKSTMIKLLMSLLRPDGGHIWIYDGGGQEAEASASTRCNMVYVPQGNSLFSGTIRENLLMGRTDATENDMKEALHTAAADFVYNLPDGLDTPCFEAGGGLSEGQAQRIAIARAMLRPGSVLLLDEFSSALDPETEVLLLNRLTRTATCKTMIFITHREKVTEWCDETLRLG